VVLLSQQKKTTKCRDQIVVLPELTYKKLTDDMPLLAAASRVKQGFPSTRQFGPRASFSPAAGLEGAFE
jgi:hypothetical protein